MNHHFFIDSNFYSEKSYMLWIVWSGLFLSHYIHWNIKGQQEVLFAYTPRYTTTHLTRVTRL